MEADSPTCEVCVGISYKTVETQMSYCVVVRVKWVQLHLIYLHISARKEQVLPCMGRYVYLMGRPACPSPAEPHPAVHLLPG